VPASAPGTVRCANSRTACSRRSPNGQSAYHRNDAPADVLEAAAGTYPVVLARSPEAVSVILTSSEIDGFGGSPARFAEWLTRHLD